MANDCFLLRSVNELFESVDNFSTTLLHEFIYCVCVAIAPVSSQVWLFPLVFSCHLVLLSLIEVWEPSVLCCPSQTHQISPLKTLMLEVVEIPHVVNILDIESGRNREVRI